MKKTKTIVAAIAGTILEFYDITLYGFFSTHFASLFFPSAHPSTSLMLSLGAFAAGFLMRPLGGVFFGYIGDKYGRKKALVVAILLVTFPTVSIGLLPSYAQIGILAPLLLVFCRLLQGFCVGGEYSGAVVFITEQAEKKRIGFAGSLLCATAFVGAIIGSGMGALCTASFMPSWGWRIPFLMGGVFGLAAYLSRKQIQETSQFSKLQHENQISRFPLREVFKKKKLGLLCTIALGASVQVPFYIASLYMQVLLTIQLSVPASHALLTNTGVMVLWMILLPIAGILSDRIGAIKLMSLSALAVMLSAYPLFLLLEVSLSLKTVLCVQGILTLAGVGLMGGLPGFIPQLFSVGERVSGTAVGLSLGQALISGVTPLVATALVTWTGDFKAPAFYLMFTSLVGYTAVKGAGILMSPKKREDLPSRDLTHPHLAT